MRGRLWFASFFVTVIVAAACGARSELEGELAAQPDAGGDAFDAGSDARDAGPDVHDAAPDVVDAGPDGEDAPPDAPPPLCSDAGLTFIYVVSSQNTLFSYYPPSGSFMPIGTIDCPAGPGQTPFSMAVDRGGTAYVVFTDGNLFTVSTATAACKATGFAVGQQGFTTFGMGFSSNIGDPGETLFVAQSPQPGSVSAGLASIDTVSLKLSFIGAFAPSLGRTELTGTGDGRLFGFSIDEPGPGAHLSEIDKQTAQLQSSVALSVGDTTAAFAYAFWGNAFYFFTAPAGGATTVTRYDPSNQSLVKVGSNPQTIVGAGVSTCAPH